MIVVDTNVLVYAANATSQFHRPCRDWLEEQRRKPEAWHVSWAIVYEFMRVTTHPRIMPRPWTASAAWQFVSNLLASPGLTVLVESQRHAEVAADVFTEQPQLAGSIMHDVHTAVLMREHGITSICTLDTDFGRFPFVEIVDPRRT
ncbi:PIN domain-containing protein [Xanthobacteraceae bacterium Astr-EGSB]|uniref:type II toxin-antitoxin system VapC family toxin n=1 Tax=Astrobacterium formosum TaxID=3069710 RepID=UPI0027B408C6|nr:PIN domain-containing protein [Xanthobacteraceae bacterium Astr-EGSB]